MYASTNYVAMHELIITPSVTCLETTRVHMPEAAYE